MASSPPTRHLPTLSDLDDLPEEVVGEIIDGELIVHPRPDPPHVWAASELGAVLLLSFRRGIDGPGGWIILDEPRIQLKPSILVPDLAGWRRERYQAPEKGPFQVTPDWICEILSPSTQRDDRLRKLPIYARNGVQHAWLLDPLQRTLEIYRRQDDAWLLVAVHGQDKVRAEPFDAIEIDLVQIWGEMPETDGNTEASEGGGGAPSPQAPES